MTKSILVLIAVGALTAACTVREERTVVERPVRTAPAPTAVIVSDPPPSTVYVPAR